MKYTLVPCLIPYRLRNLAGTTSCPLLVTYAVSIICRPPTNKMTSYIIHQCKSSLKMLEYKAGGDERDPGGAPFDRLRTCEMRLLRSARNDVAGCEATGSAKCPLTLTLSHQGRGNSRRDCF